MVINCLIIYLWYIMRIFILLLINLIAMNLIPAGITGGERSAEYKQPETTTYESTYEFSSGELIGEISIPSIGIANEPLYYLPTRENLKKGVCMDGPEGGWQMIGERGRGMISAHNDKAFRRLDEMGAGDKVFISMERGDFVFLAMEVFVYRHGVDDWKDTVYENTGEYGIVLTTCYPLNKRNTTGDRLVVRCEMMKE